MNLDILKEKEVCQMNTLLSGIVDDVRLTVSKEFRKMEQSGICPQKRLAEIATQEKWNGESYGGYGSLGKGGLGFAGGLEESVVENLLFRLDLCIPRYTHQSVISALAIICAAAIKKAMEIDEDVNLYVSSILKGMRKVHVARPQYSKELKKEPSATLLRILGL